MITRPAADPVGEERRGSRFEARGAELAGLLEPALILGRPGESRSRIPVPVGWSRIGRSQAAEIRLDDPSVSRRHGLIVHDRERGLQIIDDRSLTGIYLNGERVSWSELGDGDVLGIGRQRLIVALGQR